MTELGSGEVTVHEVDVANQCRIVQSSVDDVGFTATNECATIVRAAELSCLSQARHSWWCPEGINGARQRIQDADLEPFPSLRSEVFVGHRAREFRHALSLALAADDRLRFSCTAGLGGGLISNARRDCLQESLKMVPHVVSP